MYGCFYKIELNGNYSIEQLNNLLASSIKKKNYNNYIKTLSQDFYLFDQYFKLSLRFYNNINNEMLYLYYTITHFSRESK